MKARDWRLWTAALAAACVTATVYWPALRNDFLLWDDDINFLTNPHYRGLGWEQIRWMFTTQMLEHYHPVAWLSAAVDYCLWGMDPRGYHLTNVLLHAANASLFFAIAVRLLGIPPETKQHARRWSDYAPALIAALLFSLHPLRVEAVSWVSQRRLVLSAFFGLGALLSHLSGRRRLSLAAYVLALLSHEIWVTFPLVLIVVDAYRGAAPAASKRTWLEKAPFFIAAAAVTAIVLYGQAHKGPTRLYSLGERLAQIVYGLNFYLIKTVFPSGLSPFYELRHRREYLASAEFAAGAAALLTITAVLWRLRRRWPAALAAWACYVVTLLPVQGVIPSGLQVTADRYSYISCLGWALLAGAGCRRAKGAVLLLPFAALGAFAWLTTLQLPAWRDTESLWARALAVSPENQTARVYLAAYLRSRGRNAEAIALLEEVLTMCEGPCRQIRHDLAIALAGEGRIDRALEQLRPALDDGQGEAQARNILGAALMNAGRPAEASVLFRQAVELQPAFVEALRNLGAASAAQDKPQEAVRWYERALRADPEDPRTHGLLGAVLATQNKIDEALPHLRKASAALDEAPLHNNVGLALAHQGKTAEALEEFEKALRADPGFSPARSNRDVARRNLAASPK